MMRATTVVLFTALAYAGGTPACDQGGTCGVEEHVADETVLLALKSKDAPASDVEGYRAVFPLPENPSLLQKGSDLLALDSFVKLPSFVFKLKEALAPPKPDAEVMREHCAQASTGSWRGLVCEVPSAIKAKAKEAANYFNGTVSCLGKIAASEDKQEMDFFQCAKDLKGRQPAKLVQALLAPGALLEEQAEAARQMAEVARRLPADAAMMVPEHLQGDVNALLEKAGGDFVIIGAACLLGAKAVAVFGAAAVAKGAVGAAVVGGGATIAYHHR